MVKAKFKVVSIKRTATNRLVLNEDGTPKIDGDKHYCYTADELHTVEMTPVFHNNIPNHENNKFWDASPSGKLELGMINPEAAAYFKIGKEYYIDFTASEA